MLVARPFMQILNVSVVLAIAGISSAQARLTRHWTYHEMFEKADLVVIATFKSSRDTTEQTNLQDLSHPVSVIGVVTEFKSNLVLKGPRNITTFQLHHYRLHSPDDVMVENGPNLIRFTGAHPTYLLFLVRQGSGLYAPVTGQTDPAAVSVIELVGGGE